MLKPHPKLRWKVSHKGCKILAEQHQKGVLSGPSSLRTPRWPIRFPGIRGLQLLPRRRHCHPIMGSRPGCGGAWRWGAWAAPTQRTTTVQKWSGGPPGRLARWGTHRTTGDANLGEAGEPFPRQKPSRRAQWPNVPANRGGFQVRGDPSEQFFCIHLSSTIFVNFVYNCP